MQPLSVTPIEGEPLRYRVTSGTRKGVEHVVDLSENGGNGSCSCEWFDIRCATNLKNGQRFVPETMCKHILAVRENFLQMVLKDMSVRLNGTRLSGASSALRNARLQSLRASDKEPKEDEDSEVPF